MKGKFAGTQEIAPKVEGGCDHDGEGLVLIRFGKIKLVWRLGRAVWSGIGCPRSYCPAELQVIGLGGHHNTKTIFEGGRLSLKRVAEHMGEIVALMGLPGLLDTSKLDPKKTFLVEGP